MRNEENFPAQQSQEKEDSRFSRADEERRGTARATAAAGEGPQAAGCLSPAPCRTFPATARLKKRREYLEVYDRGIRVAGGHIVLFVLQTGKDAARLGITATRRVGVAVRRNRARRVMREVFRHHRHQLPAWDLVVNVRRSAASRSYQSLEQDFLTLVGRAAKKLSRSQTGESR